MAFAAAMDYMTPVLCETKLRNERPGVMSLWLQNPGIIIPDISLDLASVRGVHTRNTPGSWPSGSSSSGPRSRRPD